MAIVKCKECGGNVSDKAYSCPHCGYILNYEHEEKQRKILGIKAKMGLICVAAVVALLLLIEVVVVGSMFFIPVTL